MQLNKNSHKALLCFEQENGYVSSPQYQILTSLPILFKHVS